MAKTSIYFLETRTEEQRSVLCRWVERFYEEGKRIQLVADSTLAAQLIDQLLWTFSQGSFIPHRVYSSKSPGPAFEPVLITVGEVRLDGFDVLICDRPVSLELMKEYPLSVHFVPLDDEERKQESRLLWQRARDQGVQLHHFPSVSKGKAPVRQE